jgi:hypothetical protein
LRVLAVIGALFVAYQAWGYVGWLFADIPVKRNGDGVPEDVRRSVMRGEVLMVIGALVWISYVTVSTWKRGWPTWPLILSLSWALVYWQESLVNLSEKRFSYNAYFLSRGDWIPNLPLSGADKPMLDQPLLLEALVFLWLIPAVGVAIAWLLGRVSRWTTSAPILIFVGCLVAALFETTFEFSGVSQQLLVWNLVPEQLSLRGGTARQWPMTEFPLGFVWAVPGILWHFRDRWNALNWLDPTRGPRTVQAVLVRILALTAIVNIAFLAYNLTLALMPATTTADFSTWLGG